jgi:hypothetical protein
LGAMVGAGEARGFKALVRMSWFVSGFFTSFFSAA